MNRAIFILATLFLLGACSSGDKGSPRWAGLNNCSADGSVVMWEYPNKDGSFEGLNNGPCK